MIPTSLDSLLQSGQIMVPREICLPVNIARIDMYDGRFEARSFTAYAYDKVQTETHMQADVAVVKDGRVVMQLEGYRSRFSPTTKAVLRLRKSRIRLRATHRSFSTSSRNTAGRWE